MWTSFYDMSSGGTEKTEFTLIVIHSDEATATRYFKARFDRNPHHVSCGCCGEDFFVSEWETKEEALDFQHDTSLVVGEEVVRALLGDGQWR